MPIMADEAGEVKEEEGENTTFMTVEEEEVKIIARNVAVLRVTILRNDSAECTGDASSNHGTLCQSQDRILLVSDAVDETFVPSKSRICFSCPLASLILDSQEYSQESGECDYTDISVFFTDTCQSRVRLRENARESIRIRSLHLCGPI